MSEKIKSGMSLQNYKEIEKSKKKEMITTEQKKQKKEENKEKLIWIKLAETALKEGENSEIKIVEKFLFLIEKNIIIKEKQEIILDNLRQYLIIDDEIESDPGVSPLKAIISLGMKENSPLPEWNAKAKAFHEEEERKEKLWMEEDFQQRKKKREEEIERLKAFALTLKELGLEVKERKEEKKDNILPDKFLPTFSLMVKYKERCYNFQEKDLSSEYIGKLLKYLRNNMEEWKTIIQDRPLYLQGKKPVIWCKKKSEIFWEGKLELENNDIILKVPENLVRHAIGEGGRTIKGISSALMKRWIQIKKIEKINFPTKKWQIGFLTPPSLPWEWNRFSVNP